MARNITFRNQLIGEIHEFCQVSGLPFLQQDSLRLAELIVLLARYREEGVNLYPTVYITNNKDLLVSMLPDSDAVKIGTTNADVMGIQQAIKKCAPLSQGGWMVYLMALEQVNLEFGVFRGPANPLSVMIDDVLMQENTDLKVVKVSQVEENCVEIKNNSSYHHDFIHLNHKKTDSPYPLQFLNSLVEAIVSDLDLQEKRDQTFLYLKKLLFDGLRNSHGCLIAVTKMNRAPKALAKDGVILDEPIDFALLIEQLQNNQIHPSKLESQGHLIKGMLNSDGITLFDSRGRLLGYNCFIKIKGDIDAPGGARKRAFHTIKLKIRASNNNSGIYSIFMQSHDGDTSFEEMT